MKSLWEKVEVKEDVVIIGTSLKHILRANLLWQVGSKKLLANMRDVSVLLLLFIVYKIVISILGSPPLWYQQNTSPFVKITQFSFTASVLRTFEIPLNTDAGDFRKSSSVPVNAGRLAGAEKNRLKEE